MMRFMRLAARGVGRAFAFIALGFVAILPDLIGIAGLGALSYGCGLYSRPLEWIVPGFIIVAGRAWRAFSASRGRIRTMERV